MEKINIILLSGGSGQRLWPLSNGTRSKQFLKVLKNDAGEYESMIQRVYRQLTQAGINANVVIATGASQVESIKNQLGDTVDMVIEPERRDTLPAIMLAVAYLVLKKGVDAQEPAIVLPVDPYTDINYFKILEDMACSVKLGLSDLVLMGIKPTYPSSKYGYIMFDKDDGKKYYTVTRFIEKPSEEKAEYLIEKGAVWNGGVFGFRLSYVMELLKKQIESNDFDAIYNQYGILKRISFDYEVVEQCKHVIVHLYKGIWKDLGTWNTLSEEMDEEYLGNVTAGEETENTTIINELSIPLIALGAQNMVICAGFDGILVTDKEKSTMLKPYADKVHLRPMFEEFRWGKQRILELLQQAYMIKQITIIKDMSFQYQSESVPKEIWVILSGSGRLYHGECEQLVIPGDVISIQCKSLYTISAVAEITLLHIQFNI